MSRASIGALSKPGQRGSRARIPGLTGLYTEANEPGDVGSGKEQRKKAKTKKEGPINK